MKLNRTGSNWNRLERNKINENWDIIEGSYNDVVGQITDEVVGHLIDSARLDWKEPVDTVEDLPANAEVGETRMVREADPEGISYVYRYDGEKWEKIQEIDVTLVNEVDRRLSKRISDTETFLTKESMINRKARKPIITWVDDDGMVGVYNKLKPLAEEYGIPFTSALITKYLENPTERTLSIEQIKELKDIGFEFVSHTHNHDPNKRPPSMTDEEIREDFSESVRLLKKYGLNHKCVVIPFSISGWDQRVGRIAKEYFDYAIGTGATGESPDDSGEANVPPINQYYIRRTTIERGADVVKRQIDKAVAENGWVVIVSHVDNTGSLDWWDESIAREVIEYALNKGLDFVTTEEGINRFGNIAQFGESRPYMYPEHEVRLGGGTIIDADGEIHSYKLGKYRYLPKNSIGASDPIDIFPENAVSICEVTLLYADEFPRKSSGVLETYKYSEGAYHYQKYITSREKKYFIRYWNDGINGWSDWIADGVVQSLDTNGMTSSSNPRDRLFSDKISYTYIDSTNVDGFPENKRGWLVNHALLSAGVYQLYYIAGSAKVYRRNYDGSSFGDWFLVQDKLASYNLGQDGVTTINTPNDFEEGISISYISGAAGDAGLPDNSTGMLTTYKVTRSNGRTYQEFKKYNSFDKYIRYANNNNEWSAWKKFSLEDV